MYHLLFKCSSLKVWEYDIPVPIKYIADPDMFSIPQMTLHPSGNSFVGQCMDNSLVVYACGDSVKQLKKRTLKGHNNSGYGKYFAWTCLDLIILQLKIIIDFINSMPSWI